MPKKCFKKVSHVLSFSRHPRLTKIAAGLPYIVKFYAPVSYALCKRFLKFPKKMVCIVSTATDLLLVVWTLPKPGEAL